MEDMPAEFALVYASRSRRRCDEHALVLRAMGIASQVLPADGAFALLVGAADAAMGEKARRAQGVAGYLVAAAAPHRQT